MGSIPGSVGYISHVHRAYDYPPISSGFSGYIWHDTKIVLKNQKKNKKKRSFRRALKAENEHADTTAKGREFQRSITREKRAYLTADGLRRVNGWP